ncbi:MAG: nucleoside hydrolase, partial [Erysipelotrichaceae bacterium]|nr:nucleoside hydrolase [Erysipelotrichaceae bacterium]
PEAAHVVFTSDVKITMMPLDLTNTALANMQIIERMEGIGNKAGKLFGDIMRFTFSSQAVNGLDAGPVHDVTAVTYLVAPELYRTQDMFVEIDTNRYGPGYGRTICDANDRYHKKPNATVGLSIDLDRFWDLVEDTLKRHI